MRVHLLLALAVLLAGCGSKSAPEADEGIDAFGDDLKATADTGIIRGVVVDGVILPIPGAQVTLQGEDRTVTTDKEGRFGFSDLTAGTYFLRIGKVGYFEQTAQAQVLVGVDAPPVVKVVLERDAANAPYMQLNLWNGHIQCSLGGLPACRVAAALGVEERSITLIDIPLGPTWVQSEMHWVPSLDASQELWLWHGYGGGDEPGFGALQDAFGNVRGPSPLVLVTNQATTAASGQEDAFAGLGLDHELIPMVFGGAVEGTALPCEFFVCGGVGVTYDQEFTVYISSFYRASPPEAWVLTRDGDPTRG